MFNGEGFFMT